MPGKKTEGQVLERLRQAREAYHEAADTETAPQLAERSAEIKELMSELNKSLSSSAGPCPDCDTPVKVRLKTPEYKSRGVTHAAVYEAYCPACPAIREPVEGKPDLVRETEPRTRGTSPREAVDAWNAGVRLTTVKAAPPEQ